MLSLYLQNILQMLQSLQYNQKTRGYCMASSGYHCSKKKHLQVNTNLWSSSLPLIKKHWSKQVIYYICLSSYPVLCTWFYLISVCSHSTLIVWALCKPRKAFLHYSFFQQMFIFTTLLTLLAYYHCVNSLYSAQSMKSIAVNIVVKFYCECVPTNHCIREICILKKKRIRNRKHHEDNAV